MDIRKVEKTNLRRRDMKSKLFRNKKQLKRKSDLRNSLNRFKRTIYDSRNSVKVRESSIRLSNIPAAGGLTTQVEGGEEIQQAAMVEQLVVSQINPVTEKGAELFRQKVIADKKKKIRLIEPGKNLV